MIDILCCILEYNTIIDCDWCVACYFRDGAPEGASCDRGPPSRGSLSVRVFSGPACRGNSLSVHTSAHAGEARGERIWVQREAGAYCYQERARGLQAQAHRQSNETLHELLTLSF